MDGLNENSFRLHMFIKLNPSGIKTLYLMLMLMIYLQFWLMGPGFPGLAVSHIKESNCKLMSPEHHFSCQVCNTIVSWELMK